MTESDRVRAVIAAWTVPGPVPDYHRRMQNKLRQGWPALANALDALCYAPVPHNPDCTGARDCLAAEHIEGCYSGEVHAVWCNVKHAPGTSPCKKVL
jgi:hypothetical protein